MTDTVQTIQSSRDAIAAERDQKLDAIFTATAGAIAGDTDLARAEFRATGTSSGWVATDLASRQHRYVIDEPASFGGDDSAANPVEVVLGGLIACQVVTYRFWAARLGIRLDDVRIEAVGDLDVRGFLGLDESVRPGFGDVRLEVHLSGPESAERYEQLHAAVDVHCPVLDLFANATPVSTTLATSSAA